MSEITKTTDRRPIFTNRIIWLLFIALIIITYFFGLNIPLMGPDEPRYSQVAREMFARGDWITPKLGGFDWFEKPALLYWLQIVFYKLFGVSEFAARCGSALFGLGTILCLWILGKSFKSEVQSPKSKVQNQESKVQSSADVRKDSQFILHTSYFTNWSFANWLALIAASSVGLITFAHAASFDIILTFPVTAALVAFFLFEQAEKKPGLTNYLLLFTFYFFTGAALIGKGLVGIVFPFAIVAFYYLLSWKLPSRAFFISLFWGTVVSLLVAAIWYVPVYQANGWKFIDEFIIQHHFQRFTSDKYQHHQPFWFFFVVLPALTLPWTPFFLASIWNFAKDFIQQKRSKVQSEPSIVDLLITSNEPQSTDNESRTTNHELRTTNHELRITNHELRLFAFAWMLVPLVFFSLSGSKLPGYILPSLPAALILTADYIFRFVQDKPRRQIALRFAAAAVFVLTIIALQFYVVDYLRDDTVKNLVATADAAGFSDAKILNLYTVSHNVEFYGAGRLLRLPDGQQKHFDGPAEIYAELDREGKPALVLVPIDGIKYLTGSDLLNAKVLSDNGGLAIVAVEKR